MYNKRIFIRGKINFIKNLGRRKRFNYRNLQIIKRVYPLFPPKFTNIILQTCAIEFHNRINPQKSESEKARSFPP